MLELDHIAVLGETLADASEHVERCLSQSMRPGGVHSRFGTHNRLLGLEPEIYLEAIAIDPDAPPPTDSRWFGLDDFTGPARLHKWICRVPDLDAALEMYPGAGRRVDLTRGDLKWAMAVPQDGRLPFDGLFPALIEWKTTAIPGLTLPQSGIELTRLVIEHPRAQALEDLLGPRLDAPLVSFQQRDTPAMRAELAVSGRSVILS